MEELWGEAGGTTSSYTYSPTPLGRENGGQPLKCTESFPGDPLNYVSGPCTIFFPYKVGHRFGPEGYIERTWSEFGPFHVTCPPTHCPPRQHARLAIAPASPVCPRGGPSTAGGRRRAQEGCRARAHRQLVSLGCVQTSLHQLANLGVSKLTPPTGRLRGCPTQSHQLASLGVSKTARQAPGRRP